jgi:hypothetical protein
MDQDWRYLLGCGNPVANSWQQDVWQPKKWQNCGNKFEKLQEEVSMKIGVC